MSKLISFAFGAGLALASIGIAYADGSPSGTWKLNVGSDPDCVLTLTTDASGQAGPIASGAACPTGLYTVSNWKTAGAGIEFYANDGELVAALKPHGDGYVGTRFADGRKLALTR